MLNRWGLHAEAMTNESRSDAFGEKGRFAGFGILIKVLKQPSQYPPLHFNFTTISTGLSSSCNPSAMDFNSPFNSLFAKASHRLHCCLPNRLIGGCLH